MNITLTPEQEELVRTKLKNGSYKSANEVVQEALRLLEERDRTHRLLRKKIDKGLESLGRGEAVDGEEFFKELEREERELERERTRG